MHNVVEAEGKGYAGGEAKEGRWAGDEMRLHSCSMSFFLICSPVCFPGCFYLLLFSSFPLFSGKCYVADGTPTGAHPQLGRHLRGFGGMVEVVLDSSLTGV